MFNQRCKVYNQRCKLPHQRRQFSRTSSQLIPLHPSLSLNSSWSGNLVRLLSKLPSLKRPSHVRIPHLPQIRQKFLHSLSVSRSKIRLHPKGLLPIKLHAEKTPSPLPPRKHCPLDLKNQSVMEIPHRSSLKYAHHQRNPRISIKYYPPVSSENPQNQNPN
jgi:hypothetical protein